MNRCVFCGYHSDDAKEGKSNVYGLPFNLRLEYFKRIVEMCYKDNVPKVHICAAGEPFLHKDILSIIDSVIDIYGVASFQTNFSKPLFVKRNYIEEILNRKDHISHITTDVLSGDPETHETLKKGSLYEDVFSALEYISAHSNILFEVHYLITKFNYQHIDALIKDLSLRKINCHVAIVNLHPYGFNEFTSPNALYTSKDLHITRSLLAARKLGEKMGIRVSIPDPADNNPGICGSFWTRFQIRPVKGIEKTRYEENIIVGACNAVVLGNLKSLGYVFDYDNIMQLWNNDHFVRIRQDLLNGVYPDKACRSCMNYSS